MRLSRSPVRRLLSLAFAAALPALVASGAKEVDASRLLFQARSALDDALAPMAERLAREVYAAPNSTADQRLAALDLLFSAIEAQNDPTRLLATAKGDGPKGPPLPTDGRMALWQARALVLLGRPAEAASALQSAASTAEPSLAPLFALRLPATLLAAGDTNAALTAFARVVERPESGTEQDATKLEYARLLFGLQRKGDAVLQLKAWLSSAPAHQSPAADAARLLLAQLLLDGPDPQAAVAILQPLLDSSGTPPDVRAAALLCAAMAAELRADADAALSATELALTTAESPATQFASQSALVRLHCRRNQADRALAVLREVVRANLRSPEVAELQLDVTEALYRQQLYPEALQEAQNVIETQTDAAIEARAQHARGESLAAMGRFDEAALALLRAADLFVDRQKHADCLFRAAETLREADLHPQAVEALQRFQTQFPDSQLLSRAALLQGESLSQTAPADAERHLLTVAGRFPESPDGARALFLAAQLAATREDRSEAINRYTKAAELPAAPPDLRAACHVGRGLIHFRAFHFDVALSDFDQAAAQADGPVKDQALYLRTATLYNLGLEKESLDAALAFLESRPDSAWAPDVTYWLGRYFFNRQEFGAAEEHFVRFVEAWPTRPECDGALLWLARGRFAAKRYPEASATALSLIKEHPRSALVPEARLIHGEALCELMRFDEAILVFDELLTLHPDSPWTADALGRKGDALFTLGTDDQSRYQEGIAVYNALLARPGLPLDSQLQAAYKAGRCHEKSGQAEQALDLYYRAVVLRFLEAREAGTWPNERARAWFSRAALSAADLFEQQEQWASAISVLSRMAHEDVQGRTEAADRAKRLRLAHPSVVAP